MQCSTVNDDDLVAQHVSGNESAFAELVRRYTPKVRPFLIKMLQQFDDRCETADDIMQDTWLRVHNAAATYRPATEHPHQFQHWLFTIAANLAKNEHRRRRRMPQRVRLDTSNDDESLGVQLADTHPNAQPDTAFEERDMLSRLGRHLLEHASQDQLDILHAREHLGYTYDVVSERLGIQVGTVKSRYNRLRVRARNFRDLYGSN